MRIVSLAVAALMVASGVAAQEVRTFELPTPKRVKELGAAPLAKPTRKVQEDRYRNAVNRIRDHMRPIPLRETEKPFAETIDQKQANVVKKGEPFTFPKNIKILSQQSVTVSAKIQLDHASPVGEPTVAATRNEVLVTGNWYAALSKDAGKTFSALNPYELFANDPIGDGFCCDQVALYDERSDAVFWLLQGAKGSQGNTLRVLVAKAGEQLRAQDWTFVDITSPQLLGAPGHWLDFPSFVATDKYIYVSTNVFPVIDGPWVGAVVMRITKDDLLQGRQPKVDSWTSPTFGSPRLIEGAQDVMYWASHDSNGTLAVFSWEDSAAAPKGPLRVDVEPWKRDPGPEESKQHAPESKTWLSRSDSRITAGWRGDGFIGFAWNARGDNRFKLPHVRAALVPIPLPQTVGLALAKPLAQPHLWHTDYAVAYPAVGVDSKGRSAASVSLGGKSLYPTHAFGFLTKHAADDFRWGLAVTTRGVDIGPEGKWGDYFTVRPHPARENTWASVGFSVRSKSGEKLRVEPEYYWFHSDE